MIIAETQRLLISKMSIEDASFYMELVNTPHWLKYIGNRHVKTIEDAEKRIATTILSSYDQHGFGAYKLLLKDDNLKPIGSCGLYKRDGFEHTDIGFAMLAQHESKGFGYESAMALLKYAQDILKLKQICAITLPTNRPSIKLLEKLGLSYQKTEAFFEDEDELMLFAKVF